MEVEEKEMMKRKLQPHGCRRADTSDEQSHHLSTLRYTRHKCKVTRDIGQWNKRHRKCNTNLIMMLSLQRSVTYMHTYIRPDNSWRNFRSCERWSCGLIITLNFCTQIMRDVSSPNLVVLLDKNV